MTPLLNFTQTTAFELTPESQRLSPFLWTCFATINKVHVAWRFYRKVDLYTKADTLAQMLAGHIINYAFGDLLFVRIAAQCVLISTRILECSQQQVKAYKSAQHWWKAAVLGHYPTPIPRQWNQRGQSFWTLSNSTSIWIKQQSQCLYNRTMRIIHCTIKVFVNYFKLHMRLLDVIDSFFMSPYVHHEAVNEVFVNAMKWLNALAENKEELLNGLEENRGIIEKILNKSPITYLQLHKSVSGTLEKTEFLFIKAKSASEAGGGILVELGKRILSPIPFLIGIKNF